MEVFMRNIAFVVDEKTVIREIAAILHKPPYSDHAPNALPLNFKVFFFPNKRNPGLKHGGCGKLTLPSEAVGQLFLAEYGELAGPRRRPFFIGGRPIVFSESKTTPRADVLEEITRLPYLDPQALQEQQKIAEQFARERVRVRTVQFGWFCRDYVFSCEYERGCESGYIRFEDESRELRVKVQDKEEDVTRVIAIHFSQIDFVSVGIRNGDPVIFFSLQRPPAFETELSEFNAGIAALGLFGNRSIYDRHPRRRFSAFDAVHEETVAYSAYALRIVCTSPSDLQTFRSLWKTSGRAELQSSPPPLERRNLFSAHHREAFAAWLLQLDFGVAFQLEALTRRLVVDLTEALDLREDVKRVVSQDGPGFAAELLRSFYAEAKELMFEQSETGESPETMSQCFVRCERDLRKNPPKAKRVARLDDDIFDCYHIMVTPSSYELQGPFPERLNRVIRKFPDHMQSFVRVSFVDENRLSYRAEREVDGPDFIKRRVGGVLNGFRCAGKEFEFLAYSQSALKEHSVWFITPFHDAACGLVNAEKIISGLGVFHNLVYDPAMSYCPARYAARISQSFTATDSSITMEAEEVIIIKDIKRNGSCFTDGVGTLSPSLARAINKALYGRTRRRRKPIARPVAFQVRFQGAKGMLTVDHALRGDIVCLRDSMIKFDAPDSTNIEIAQAFDRPSRYYLNRPLIMLLEGLGVPFEVFKAFQDAAVREAYFATQSLGRTAHLMESHGLGTSFRLPSVLLQLHKLGVQRIDDSFYHRMTEFAVHHVLRELKHHARIPIPGGWTLVGAADVHGFLKPDEVHICVRCPHCYQDCYLEGRTVVSRSPTIHPGDVQILTAVGKPGPDSPFYTEPLRQCIIFSTRGERSIPSYLGGGDLDGDTYNVWSPSYTCRCAPQWAHLSGLSLMPTRIFEPAAYDPAPKKLVDHPATMVDVRDFFCDYITSDVLGLVAINWLIIADQSPDGIVDSDCLLLAQLHSDSVDYAKSGTSVAQQRIPKLKFRAKPDWNAPETLTKDNARYYESQRAIGKLFRAIDLPALEDVQRARKRQRRALQDEEERTIEELLWEINDEGPYARDPVELAVERHIRASDYISMGPVTLEELEQARALFRTHANQTHAACISHTLSQSRNAMLTEQELLVGTIVAKSSQPRRRKDLMSKMREVTAVTVRDIRDELKGDDGQTLEEWLRRSYVAWKLALLEEDTFGGKTFWWITLGAIFDAMRAIEDDERAYDYA